MKKLTIILATFLSSSFNLDAAANHHWLYCNRAGQAYIMDALGNYVAVGGCAFGPWGIQLDLVLPTGNPSIPEASPDTYQALNTPPSNPSAQPSAAEKAEMNVAIKNSNVKVWVNPLKLTSAAYSKLYGGTTYLPLFYVNTSLGNPTSINYLSLYSDNNRNITVTYKTLNSVVISSENFAVVKGYNSLTLSTATLANGTYIITVFISGGYQVNRTLIVNR